MTTPKRLLVLFLTVSVLFTQTAQAYSDIQGSWQIGTQQTHDTTQGSASGVHYFTDNIQHTGSVIQVGGQSNINVAKDLIAQGAQIKLQGGGNINAGGNVELKAVKNSFKSDSSTTTSDHYGRNQSYDETLMGTNLQSGPATGSGQAGLTITSGKDITLSSSTVSVKNGNTILAAAGNVNLLADTETHTSSIEDFSSKNNVVSNTRRTSLDEVSRTKAIGSSLDGDRITIQSGKDINVVGSDVSAKQDITLLSMGDINIKAATETYQATHKREAVTNGLVGSGMGMTIGQDKQSTETNIDGATQSQSRSHLTSSNGNVRLMSGNNTLIVGSDLAATQGKLAIAAGGGIGIFAGQDTLKQYTETQHSRDTDVFSKQKRVVTDTLISSRYQGSTLAGNSIALDAGANLVLQAAQLNSTGDTSLAAGGDLKLLSATDSTYSKHTETLQTDGIALNTPNEAFADRRKNSAVTSKIDTNQVTAINSGGNLSTRSGGNTLIEASTLDAGGSIALKAGYDAKGNAINPDATLTFAAVKDSNYLSIEDKHSSLSWQSQSGSGHYNETVKLANIKSGKGLSVDATGGIVVDIPEVQNTAPAPAPSGLIATPIKAPLTAKETAQAEAEQKRQDAQRLKDHLNTLAKQPGQEWLGQLAHDPKLNVQFKQVSAAAQHWDYSHDGLTPEAAGVIAIAVAYVTAGAASGAAGAITGAAAGTTTIASAALAAGMTTLASQASLALINNKGDLGKTLDDMGKSENVKALVTAMVTAGVMQGLNTSSFMHDLKLDTVNAQSSFIDQLQKNLINQSTGAVINHAINGGDLSKQLEQSLKNAFIDTGAAQGANLIGDLQQNGTLDAYTHKLAHAIAGCAAGAAKSNDCSSGALGAVVGEITAELYAPNGTAGMSAKQIQDMKRDTINFSKLIAGVAAALTGNDVNVAAGTAGNAVENNYLNHNQMAALDKAWKNCSGDNACQNKLITEYRQISDTNDNALKACQDFTCIAGHLTAINQANSTLATLYQDDPTGRLGMVVNKWQATAQTQIAPMTVAQRGLVTNRKEELTLYMNEFCRGGSAESCATQILSNEKTAKIVGELAYMSMMLTPVGAVDDGKTLATGTGLNGEESSRLLALLGMATLGEGSALAKVIEKAGGLVQLAKTAVQGTPEAAKLIRDLEAVKGAIRPTPKQSEIDVGTELLGNARPQVSYKDGKEVPYGTSGSVRPDWCVGNVCSVEVKNYNIAMNSSGLVSNVAEQAIKRQENLPTGMLQEVVIDIRGQMVTDAQKNAIIQGIVQKTNGVISPTAIGFKEK